jgi:hypothetical protein
MKFGIYGDSYVTAIYNGVSYNDQTWVTQLATKLGATSCHYHGRAGSSLYYSYKQMLATADRYDACILAATEPTRYPSEDMLITTIEHAMGLPESQTKRNLIGWYSAMNVEFMEEVQELMLSKLESKFTVYVVPCFPQSFNQHRRDLWNNFSLSELNSKARELAGIRVHKDEVNGSSGILTHIPAEWHTVLADMLDKYFTQGKTIKLPESLSLLHTAGNYFKI